MAEDDIVELLCQNGQIDGLNQIQRPTSENPPPILRGSGSGGGGGEENALFLHQQPSDQNLFIQEDEMASWLLHQNFCSDILCSTLATQPQIPPPLSSPYDPPAERPPDAIWPENLMSFSRRRENIFTGGRVEAEPSISVVRQSTQVGSSATSSSSATESCLKLATHSAKSIPMAIGGGVSHTSVVIGTSSSRDYKAETEPIQIQPETETETADDRKRKERDETEETREARGSIARKRTRAEEMHYLAERRRREKINEKMKSLQELIPRCNKTNKASMLDDVIEYVKLLHMKIQMISMGGGTMHMIHQANMQRFMPHMAMGMMGMNQPPFISQTHMASLCPVPRYPIPNVQASQPSRVQILNPEPNPVSNQHGLLAYMNPYSQFVGLHQMQQPPPQLQNQTTSNLSFSHASGRKEHEDQDNQPTG